MATLTAISVPALIHARTTRHPTHMAVCSPLMIATATMGSPSSLTLTFAPHVWSPAAGRDKSGMAQTAFGLMNVIFLTRTCCIIAHEHRIASTTATLARFSTASAADGSDRRIYAPTIVYDLRLAALLPGDVPPIRLLTRLAFWTYEVTVTATLDISVFVNAVCHRRPLLRPRRQCRLSNHPVLRR